MVVVVVVVVGGGGGREKSDRNKFTPGSYISIISGDPGRVPLGKCTIKKNIWDVV